MAKKKNLKAKKNQPNLLCKKINLVLWSVIFLVSINYVVFSVLLVNRDIVGAAVVLGNPTVGSTVYPDAGIKKIAERQLIINDPMSETSVIDTVNNYEYLAGDSYAILAPTTFSSIPVITKINLNPATPQRVEAIRLKDYPADTEFIFSVIDEINGYAYFGLSGLSGRFILKVDINPANTFSVVGTSLSIPYPIYSNSAVFDPVNQYIYFGSSNIVVRVDVSTPIPTLAGQVFLAPFDYSRPMSPVIDLPNGFVYFSALTTSTGEYGVIKIDTTTFSFVSGLDFNSPDEDYECRTAAIDQPLGFAYFSTFLRSNNPTYGKDKVVKVDLATFTRVGAIELATNELWPNDSVVDPVNHYLYVGTRQSPGHIVKIDVNDPIFAAVNTVASPGNHVHTVEIDGTNIFSSAGEPIHYFSKLDLVSFSFNPGTFLMAEQGGPAEAGVWDQSNNLSYWGTFDTPAKIFKLDLNTYRVTNEITLPNGEQQIGDAIIDPVNKYAYFGTAFTGVADGKIVKVNVDPAEPFVRESSIMITPHANSGAAFNPLNQTGYFGFYGGPSMFHKFNLNHPTFSYSGGMTDPNPSNGFYGLIVDPVNDFAYYGLNYGGAIHVSKVNIAPAVPTLVTDISLSSSMISQLAAIYDPVRQLYFYADIATTGMIGKVDVNPGNTFQELSTMNLPAGLGTISYAVFDSNNNRGYFVGANNLLGNRIRIYKVNLDATTPSGLDYFGTYNGLAADIPAVLQNNPIIDFNNNFIYIGTETTPGRVIKYHYSQRGLLNAFKVTVPAEIDAIDYFEFYSHQASGNIRLALYNSSFNLVWQSNSVANTKTNNWLRVDVSNGTPAALGPVLAGDYWLAWQTDSSADIGAYLPTTAGNGFYVMQAYGNFPAVVAPAPANFTDQAWSIYAGTVTASRSSRGGAFMPTMPIDFACQAQSANSINWTFTDTANNETGFRLYDEANEFVLDTLPEITENLTFLSENNLLVNDQYTRYVVAFNGAGESRPTDITSCFTLANTPDKPTASPASASSFILKINTNSNPEWTEYAIYEESSKQYVQTDGTFGPDPVWQTFAAWGGEQGLEIFGTRGQVTAQLNIALTTGVEYQFTVKARNGDDAETVFSPVLATTIIGTEVPAPVTPPVTPPVIPPVTPPVTPPAPTPGTTTPSGGTTTGGGGTAGTPGTTGGTTTTPVSPGTGTIPAGTGTLPLPPAQPGQEITERPVTGLVKQSWLANLTLEKIVVNIITPLLLAIALLNILSAAPTLVLHLLPFLHLLFTEPFLWLFRRKRQKWGIVYNALSKMPVDLAVVRLYNKTTNQLVQTKVTDKDGRYIFMVKDPGKYYISVNKPGFSYPTKYLQADKQDSKYVDLYHGEEIVVKAKQGSVTANIPLDPIEEKRLSIKEVLNSFFQKNLRQIVAYAGIILAILIVIIYPSTVTVIALLAHIALYLIFRRLTNPGKPKTWGIVYDQANKAPLNQTVVRIFDTRFNKLLETQVSDAKGRYAFLVGENQYQLLAEKLGYSKKEIKPIDLTKQKEIIDLDIALVKGK